VTARVKRDLCLGCGACREACPVEAIRIRVTAIVNAEKCASCGLCVETCPQYAITV